MLSSAWLNFYIALESTVLGLVIQAPHCSIFAKNGDIIKAFLCLTLPFYWVVSKTLVEVLFTMSLSICRGPLRRLSGFLGGGCVCKHTFRMGNRNHCNTKFFFLFQLTTKCGEGRYSNKVVHPRYFVASVFLLSQPSEKTGQ